MIDVNPDSMTPKTEPIDNSLARHDRRSGSRLNNDARFNVARAAIEYVRAENTPEFDAHVSDFEIMQRITRLNVSQGTMTEESRDKFLREYHGAQSASDVIEENSGAYNDATIKRTVTKLSSTQPDNGKEHIAVAVDLDGLKKMNEESLNKHQSADRAIAEWTHFHIAKLYERFGYSARIGRINKAGDEFFITVPNTTVDEVNQFFIDIEEERARAMKVIVDEERLPADITATKAAVPIKPGETFDEIYIKADQKISEQKLERNRLRNAELQTRAI